MTNPIKDKDKTQHYEDEKVRVSYIPMGEMSEEELKKDLDEKERLKQMGLVITWEGNEFVLKGFTSWQDTVTKEWILHYKFNHKERLLLYLKTNHPRCEEMLHVVSILSKLRGYQVRNIYDYIEHMMTLHDKAKAGELEFKDGPHPNMQDKYDQMTKKKK